MSLMGVALAYFCLDEVSIILFIFQESSSFHDQSLSTRRRSTYTCTETISDEVDPKSPSPTARELLSIPIIRSLCLSGFALETNGTSFVVLFVLFCYTPIQQGGLAFPVSYISMTISLQTFMIDL